MEFHFFGLQATSRSSHVTTGMDSMHFFTLFYFLFCFCVVFPVPVFVSCGLTVDSIFSKWIGDEMESFINFHIRRIVATILVHSSLPLGYVLLRMYFDPDLDILDSVYWQFLFFGSLTLLFVAGLQIYNWISNGWLKHPVVVKLRAFSVSPDLGDIIQEIDNDFRSPHKVILQCDPTSKVISSPNWVLKTSAYSVDIAHQSDVFLKIMSADHHEIAADTRGGVQYLTIRVTCARPNVSPFYIRIKSTSLKDLQDMIARPIRILDNIKIHSTLQDRFLDVFKEQVALNPTVDMDFQGEDDCWGCSEKRPNVKLMKTCGDSQGTNSCKACFCRPMWCVDCMGIWFASRQDQEKPEQWMSAKCTCPLCRSTFCVLDVCYIQSTAE